MLYIVGGAAMKQKLKKNTARQDYLDAPLLQDMGLIIPEDISTYVKNMAIYIGKQSEKVKLEGFVQTAKDKDELALINSQLKDCEEWIKHTEPVHKSLESRLNRFKENTPERDYMDDVYAVIIAHAESRNKKYIKYSEKITDWGQKKKEFQSGLSKFKRAVAGKVGSMVGPAVGIGAGGLAGLLGADIRSCTELAVLVGAAGYIGEKAVKYLLFKNKPSIVLEEKLLRYYDKKIEQNEELRDQKKGDVYQRAFELSANAYKRYLSRKKIRKQRVLKKIAPSEGQPHIYEISSTDYKRLLNVEKMALEYELVRRNYEGTSAYADDSLSPKTFQESAEKDLEKLRMKHEKEDRMILGETPEPIKME